MQRSAYSFFVVVFLVFFFFNDGQNIIGLHIAVAAACSVGIFWVGKSLFIFLFL